jgi:hypothetical protein
MRYDKMTNRQKDAASGIRDELGKLGVQGASVSQVAKYFDEAMAWRIGDLTLEALCEQTGWVPPAQDAAEDSASDDGLAGVRAAKAALLKAQRDFRVALRAAYTGPRKVSANVIADEVDGLMSRPSVLKVLGAESLADKARRVLDAAGWDPFDALLLTTRSGTTLDLAGESAEGSHTARHNAAAAILNTLLDGGIGAGLAGWMTTDLADALADGHSVELHELRQ